VTSKWRRRPAISLEDLTTHRGHAILITLVNSLKNKQPKTRSISEIRNKNYRNPQQPIQMPITDTHKLQGRSTAVPYSPLNLLLSFLSLLFLLYSP
jgi:hypothetical protein